jgi:hypothetical protein
MTFADGDRSYEFQAGQLLEGGNKFKMADMAAILQQFCIPPQMMGCFRAMTQ